MPMVRAQRRAFFAVLASKRPAVPRIQRLPLFFWSDRPVQIRFRMRVEVHWAYRIPERVNSFSKSVQLAFTNRRARAHRVHAG